MISPDAQMGLTIAAVRLRHHLCPAHEAPLQDQYCQPCGARYRLEVVGDEFLIHYENDRGERARARVRRAG